MVASLRFTTVLALLGVTQAAAAFATNGGRPTSTTAFKNRSKRPTSLSMSSSTTTTPSTAEVSKKAFDIVVFGRVMGAYGPVCGSDEILPEERRFFGPTNRGGRRNYFRSLSSDYSVSSWKLVSYDRDLL
mmetsp:Transcript_12765/g.18826  ORF Transcript_12765/g.18826 Transcript_12765/m.18826 type:complete len:130 (-) Transcript_12765:201-590(-)